MKNNSKDKVQLALVPAEFLEQILKSQSKILEALKVQGGGSGTLGDYISETEAKKLLGRKTTWFWSLRKDGKLPFTHVGKRIYYSMADIIKLMDRNKHQPGI